MVRDGAVMERLTRDKLSQIENRDAHLISTRIAIGACFVELQSQRASLAFPAAYLSERIIERLARAADVAKRLQMPQEEQAVLAHPPLCSTRFGDDRISSIEQATCQGDTG